MVSHLMKSKVLFCIFTVVFSCSMFFLGNLYGEEVPVSNEVKDLVDDAQDPATEDMYDDPYADPSLSDESEPAAIDEEPIPEDITYTVVKGDSLYVIAKKNDVTVANLKKANNLTSDLIKVGMTLKIPRGKYSILVDKSDNTLQLLLNGQPYKTYSVATGKDNSTPVGEFKVTDKLENPTWYTAGAIVEPGSPENIIGTRWIGYSLKGYGIHGTTEPETIGTQASAGCVRMHNKEVEELYDIVTPGTVVKVQD